MAMMVEVNYDVGLSLMTALISTINTKNLRSFITVKARCLMTHL